MKSPAPVHDGRVLESVDAFLSTKATTLTDRARRLGDLDPRRVGLRREDAPFSPSTAHFKAANSRLVAIDRNIRKRLLALHRCPIHDVRRRLLQMALVEREVDRSRRAFGLFFEIFAQRGTSFAASLAAHDVIARDCYVAALSSSPGLLRKPLLTPLTYMEHGYSPATMRRGVTLKRLLGEPNPFPLIRIPWDRDRPWQATFLHEVAHNLQADLGVWEETKQAVKRRLATTFLSEELQGVWAKWHKEIFADLAAVLLGGPAAAFGLAEFLAHPPAKVALYKAGGVHPTGFLRGLILAEMLRRMGFQEKSRQLADIWTTLYRDAAQRRLPKDLMASAAKIIPVVVDEIAYQPRRMLAERGLADVIRFDSKAQKQILVGARHFRKGRIPRLPPRWLIGAARTAIEKGADARRVGDLLTKSLAAKAAVSSRRGTPSSRSLAVAA